MAEDEIRWGPWPGAGWTPVTYGAHVRADLADDLAARLRAWQLVLPFWSSFTGLTAAMLRGWWVPPLPDHLRRAGRISDAGFERRGYTREDVLYAASSILRDADRALGRPHAPERIEAWYDALRPSLFSASGRHRLMRRLGLEEENAEQPGL